MRSVETTAIAPESRPERYAVGVPDPAKMGARCAPDLDIASVHGLSERFGLTHPLARIFRGQARIMRA